MESESRRQALTAETPMYSGAIRLPSRSRHFDGQLHSASCGSSGMLRGMRVVCASEPEPTQRRIARLHHTLGFVSGRIFTIRPTRAAVSLLPPPANDFPRAAIPSVRSSRRPSARLAAARFAAERSNRLAPRSRCTPSRSDQEE